MTPQDLRALAIRASGPRGGRTARAVCERLALQRERDFTAPTARALFHKLGVHVSDKTACAALRRLATLAPVHFTFVRGRPASINLDPTEP